MFLMEKFLENLQEAEKTLKKASHLLYMTYPLVKDKKLLLRIITELKEAVVKCINAILQYEYFLKRIALFKDQRSNFHTFEKKCAKWYNINSTEIKQIIELFYIAKQHEKSPMEFMKDEKLVILTEDSTPITITLEKTKEFLETATNVINKTKEKFYK